MSNQSNILIFPLSILSLLLAFPQYTFPASTSDEEIRALEKQIEQKEAEQAEIKKKANEEAKRKAEEERLRADQEQKQKLEEEVRRDIEEKKKQVEEDEKARAESEKKDKFAALIKEADDAVRNKDKDLALNKYSEALKIYPEDSIAIAGMKEAEKMVDKICADFPGVWKWDTLDGFIRKLKISCL